MNAVVPFGKYKGQSAEAMAADIAYTEWAMAQAEMVKRYAPFFNALKAMVNIEDTPTHNALQAKFLDAKLLSKTARIFDQPQEWYDNGPCCVGSEFEVDGFDVLITFERKDQNLWPRNFKLAVELKPSLGDDFPAVLRQMKSAWQFAHTGGRTLREPSHPHAMMLIVEQFNSATVSLKDAKMMFDRSGITLMTLAEIEATV